MYNAFPRYLNEVQLRETSILYSPVMAVTHQLDEVKVSSFINKQFVTKVITESFIYLGYVYLFWVRLLCRSH